jgi:hypothetical protein
VVKDWRRKVGRSGHSELEELCTLTSGAAVEESSYVRRGRDVAPAAELASNTDTGAVAHGRSVQCFLKDNSTHGAFLKNEY